jgi:hypothetical protein
MEEASSTGSSSGSRRLPPHAPSSSSKNIAVSIYIGSPPRLLVKKHCGEDEQVPQKK